VLSAEEIHVLSLLGRGLDHPQILKQHGIPVDTSRRHLRDAMRTLGAPNALNAYALAVAHELIPPDSALQE
jgi:DNA-binding CsgD family transcriptional regulator